MQEKKLSISALGCCLVDRLYNDVSFEGKSFLPFYSKNPGDGGLVPGQLVFEEEFEAFSGMTLESAVSAITGGKKPNMINVGGPGIVALIHAAQMLGDNEFTFHFHGLCSNDDEGKYLYSTLKQLPIDLKNFRQSASELPTPSTIVFSDPAFDQGHGERTFINSIGSAWNLTPDDLDESFFESEVIFLGGTALVPMIHDNLSELLIRAKRKGCITVVGTIFDFRNEKADPCGKWPLGGSDQCFANIDLLIMDHTEALRLSGSSDIERAMHFFLINGVGAAIVTNGSKNIKAFSKGSIWSASEEFELPVSNAVKEQMKIKNEGDTTGCGDNFAGGIIASLLCQLKEKTGSMDLKEACIWGIVSGGFSCFYMGGTYHEDFSGEKRKKIESYYRRYREQLASNNE